MNQEILNAAVDNATRNYNTYPSSFSQVQEQYKEKYGERRWIGQLVQDMRGLSPKDGREYKSARRQVERWADGTRSPGKAAQGQLKEVGKTLEPIKRDAPPGGLTFSVDFKVHGEKKHGKRDRHADIKLDYATAVKFVQNPNYSDLFDEWFDDGGDAYGEGGDYEADVYNVSAA